MSSVMKIGHYHICRSIPKVFDWAFEEYLLNRVIGISVFALKTPSCIQDRSLWYAISTLWTWRVKNMFYVKFYESSGNFHHYILPHVNSEEELFWFFRDNGPSYKASLVQPYKASLVVDFLVIRHELQYVILIYKRSINNSCISMLCFFYFSTFLLHLLFVKFSLRFSFLSVNISRRFSNVFRIEMYWKKSSKINWSS